MRTVVDTYYTDNSSADAKTAVSGGGMFLLEYEQAIAIADINVRKCSNAWWLCSQGQTDNRAMYVLKGGGVDVYGRLVYDTHGVRPALKLNLSSVIFSSESNTFFVKKTMPSATFTATGADTGTLSGVTAGMKYSLDGTTWTDITSNAEINLTGLSAGSIQVVKKGDGTATVDSDAQTTTVTKATTPNTTVTQPTVIGGKGTVATTTDHE